MKVYVDHTHLGRRVTGIERITMELFARHSLAPIELVPVTARGTAKMTLTQTFGLPLRMTDPSTVLLDDVMSELDPRRQRFLQDVVRDHEQVLLTATDLSFFAEDFMRDATIFRVEAGSVRLHPRTG